MNIFRPAEAVDEQAFDAEFTEIVNLHLDPLYNYTRYMVTDGEEASDIVQTTFLTLYKNFKKLDRSQPLKPWLYKVARNNCLDYLKKKRALNFSELDMEIYDIPETDTDLEVQANSEILQESVRQILDSLPTTVKEIMVLHYFDDFSFEQIAQQLELPLNTIKSHFYRGKSRIYQQLKQQIHGHN